MTKHYFHTVPEGISAPFVSAGVGQPVLIAWTPPTSPNGVLLLYRVERRGPGDSLVTIGTLPASASSLIVGDQMTTPFTEYEYRVVAENSVGSVASSFSPFLTLEAGTNVGVASAECLCGKVLIVGVAKC